MAFSIIFIFLSLSCYFLFCVIVIMFIVMFNGSVITTTTVLNNDKYVYNGNKTT